MGIEKEVAPNTMCGHPTILKEPAWDDTDDNIGRQKYLGHSQTHWIIGSANAKAYPTSGLSFI